MRFVTAILFTLISWKALSIPMVLSPFDNQIDTRTIVSQTMVYSVCGKPEDLVPGAKALIDKYFSSEMLNSDFYRDFLWLEPEEERYVSCLICESEKPNDPYWEHNFNLWCQIDFTDTHPVFEQDPYEGQYPLLSL